jgi:hypothetical protein
MVSQGISTTEILKTQLSDGKVMASVYPDSEGVMHVDFST